MLSISLFRKFFLSALLVLVLPCASRADHILVRGDYNYPPYEYLENGIPVGFNVDMMRAVAEVMGLHIRIDLGPWEEVRSQLERGEIDALTGMYYSPERARNVEFSTPHIKVSHSIFVRVDSDIRSLEDLSGKDVLVQKSDIMHDYALANLSESNILVVESQIDALRLISSGMHDAALLGKLQNLFWARQEKMVNIATVGPPIEIVDYCFAARKGNDRLISQFNEGLALVGNSGKYDEIYHKWFGAYEQESMYGKAAWYALWGGGPLVLLLAVLVVWHWQLRRKVAQKTAELTQELNERVRVEAALRESEAKFRGLIESTSDWIWEVNKEGTYSYASPQVEGILGYKPEEIVGKSPFYFMPEDEIVRVEGLLREFFESGRPITTLENACLHRDGRRIVLETSGVPVLDQFGNLVGYRGVDRDITDRKIAERQMRLVQYGVDGARDAVFWLNRETKLLYVNDAACRSLGYSREELLNMKISQIDPDFPPEAWEPHLAELRRHKSVKFESRHRKKDGRVFPVEVTSNYLMFEGEEGSFSFARDITNRKRSEEVLRLNESRLETLVELGRMSSNTMQEITDFALEEAVKLTGSKIGYLAFLNEDESVLTIHSWSQSAMKECGIAGVPIVYQVEKTGLWGEVVRQRKPVVTNDYNAPNPLKRGIPKGHVAVNRHMNVPVFDGKRIVAVAGVGNKEGDYDQSDVRQLTLLMEGMWKLIQRKRAEEEIRHVFEHSLVGILRTDFSGRLLLINPSGLRILGYDSLDAVNKVGLVNIYNNPQDRERLLEALKDNHEVTFETQLVRFGGEVIDVLLKVYTISDEDGNVRFLESNLIDITDRKLAEQALKKRIVTLTRPLGDVEGITFEELFDLDDIQLIQDQFADATGVASIITNIDGTPITAPSNFCRLCKDVIRKTEKGLANCFRSDAVLGKFQLDGPQIQECLSGGLWDAGAGIAVGSKHLANWLIGQVRDEAQTVERIRSYAREIGADEDEAAEAFLEVPAMSRERFGKVAQALFSIARQLSNAAFQNVQQARLIYEQQQAEDELQRLRNLLANVVDSMPSVLIGVDVDGRIIQWNAQAEKKTGISSAEATGKILASVYPRLASEMERIGDAIRHRVVQVEPRLIRHLDGETGFEDMTIYPLISNGIEGAVIRLDDVTDRVHFEEMMIQSEKMVSIGGMAAGMAHEINNPLGVIMAAAQSMTRRFSSGLKGNVEAARKIGVDLEKINEYNEIRGIYSYLEGVREAGERAAKIVRNMLNFSRKSDSVRSLHHLSEVLDRSVELASKDYDLKKKYDFRMIEIIRHYAPDTPPVMILDTEIEQVFLNLLKNAAQAMGEKEYGDQKPTISLSLTREGRWVRVEIEDNGPGMDQETRKRIFEPFFTTKAVGVGTGLGLSVSYFIVTDQHKGRMDVLSEPGRFTRFIIRLPVD